MLEEKHLIRGFIKNVCTGAEEMAQRLRALAALPEDPGSIPSAHMAADNFSNSSSRDLMYSSAPTGSAHTWFIYIHDYRCLHTKNTFFFF